MRSKRIEAGFTLALTMMVTAVVVMLAAGLMLRIMNDVKGAKISSQQAVLSGDAEVALNMAESEIFQDIELLHSAVWAATMSDVILDDATPGEPDADPACGSPNVSCTPDDCPGPNAACNPVLAIGPNVKPFPLRQLQLLGNVRNWPAFANWEWYQNNAANLYSGGYRSNDATGSVITAPARIWAATDAKLTKNWWAMPRDNNADNDYYTSTSVGAPDTVFPSVIAGEKSTRVAKTSYRLDAEVWAVTHNYFYEELFPIKGEKIAANRIPLGSTWPNAADEYGTGANATASGTIAATVRYVWDTPFYKKMYKLQNNRKVAVFCRLDLRDYFKPDAAAAAKDKWTQPDPNNGARSKDNFVKFFLAAIPEGRLDRIPGENKEQYYGGELKTKYILIKTGGMENVDLSGVSQPNPSEQHEDRQYPGVIHISGGSLRGAQDATTGIGQDIRGMAFRADGNRAFNWSTLSTRSVPVREGPAPGINPWTPIASERYVYLFERVAEFQSPVYLIWAQYPHSAVDQGTRVNAPNNIDTSQMFFRRSRMDDLSSISTGSFQEPDTTNNVDATVSIQASFSGFVDRYGQFVISAASGWPGDCPTYSSGKCPDGSSTRDNYNIERFWRGPVAGRTYWTAQYPAKYNRQGSPFLATASINAGVSNMR